MIERRLRKILVISVVGVVSLLCLFGIVCYSWFNLSSTVAEAETQNLVFGRNPDLYPMGKSPRLMKKFNKYYQRSGSLREVRKALDMYCGRKSVFMEQSIKEEVANLVARRLKGSRTYEYTSEDLQIIDKVKSYFPDVKNFELDFLRPIKVIDYTLERYKGGEIKYEELDKIGMKNKVFRETNLFIESLEDTLSHPDLRLKKEKEDCMLFSRKLEDGNKFECTKGTTVFETSFGYEDIARYIFDIMAFSVEPEEAKEYFETRIDENIDYCNALYMFDEDHCVLHLRYSGQRPFYKARDYVITHKYLVDDECQCAYVFGIQISEDHEDLFPVDRDYAIRGLTSFYIYKVNRADRNRIQISYTTHFDLKGHVPGWLVNKGLQDVPLKVARVRDEILKMDG